MEALNSVVFSTLRNIIFDSTVADSQAKKHRMVSIVFNRFVSVSAVSNTDFLKSPLLVKFTFPVGERHMRE
jgi:hypothetical protein